MEHNLNRRLLSMAFCILLIAASALCMFACSDPAETPTPPPSSGAETDGTDRTPPPAENNENGTTKLGEGDTTFTLTVSDKEKNETVFTIRTDERTVGDALVALDLLEGEEGPYGLYIKKVNGITADYETTGTYWAFYINGEYAMTGVDTTEITDGASYELKVEKG